MSRRVLIFAAVAAALVIANVTFFFFRDNFATHYPIKVISAEAWRSGHIPWWNFNDGGGQPLAGNPNTLSFYPDNVLYLVVSPHVAFNFHFLLHLALGWLAMRALSRSRFAAWLYVASGIAISATAFYNLIVAFALIPFAWWALERRSWPQLGLAFGLLALAGEPVTIAGAALGCLILWPHARMHVARVAAAVALAFAIAMPQLIAYGEIAHEVERGAFRYSARTVLAASMAPQRILELLIGPVLPNAAPHLFLSLIVGVIAIPAIARKSRYTAVAATMLFLALGRFNPLVAWAVERIPALRLGRYPEKFALPLCIALVVLAGAYFRETRLKLLWSIVTFAPLIVWGVLTIPIDWFAPYDVPQQLPKRVFVVPLPGGQMPDRAEYHERARRLEPLFGAVAGVRYALDRSPDGMFSIWTRVASERLAQTHNPNYLRITTGLPPAFFVPRVVRVLDPVKAIETPGFDPRTTAASGFDFQSPPGARVVSVTQYRQSMAIDVITPAPAVLFVNETYFRAWDAGGLRTFPLDLDRLGVLVPPGRRTITLTFGRHHTAVAATWILSSLLIVACLVALRVEEFDGSAGEVERAADED